MTLVEQLVTGFHEKNDVAFLPQVSADPDFSMEDVMGDKGLKAKVCVCVCVCVCMRARWIWYAR
jgi:hypothetical protein